MRNRILTILALVGLVAASSCTPGSPAAIDPTSSGSFAAVPGDDGACGVKRTDHFNPAEYRYATTLYEPTGPGECGDDERPLIVFAHGYTSTIPEPYEGTIHHFVSRGFVVVYSGYTAEFDPDHQYNTVDVGIDVGVNASGRVDTDRVGVVGHSFGGGMTPYLLQRIVERGWGSDALFGALLSPAWAFKVGDGAIELPPHTRLLAVTYEEDTFVDMQVATEILDAATVPTEQKQHMLIHSDYRFVPALVADHLLPLNLPFGILAALDHYDRWGTFRPVDALANCAISGTDCDIDLTNMGSVDGVEVRRAAVGLGLVDVGPYPTLVECNSPLSPRACTFG